MAESKTTKKTTKRTSKKTASKKSEAITEAVEQIQETPVIDEVKPKQELSDEIFDKVVSKSDFKMKTIRVGEVISEQLNIRKGPGLNFSKVGKLHKGDEVEVLEKENGFARIGHEQWCLAENIGGI